MYLGKVKWELIQEARNEYLQGLPEGETRSAHLNLSMLKEFLKEVDEHIASGNQEIEDIGVVFYRGGLGGYGGDFSQLEDGRYQMNFAIVAKIGDEAFVLTPGGESTGLCPKNCGKI